VNVYHINILARVGAYIAFGLFLAGIVLRTIPQAPWLLLVFGAFALVGIFVVCPTCGKSLFRGALPPREPVDRYDPLRTWVRLWPERTCSECGRHLDRR
jgi:hypothetical protein